MEFLFDRAVLYNLLKNLEKANFLRQTLTQISKKPLLGTKVAPVVPISLIHHWEVRWDQVCSIPAFKKYVFSKNAKGTKQRRDYILILLFLSGTQRADK